jgi:hypothetical protein
MPVWQRTRSRRAFALGSAYAVAHDRRYRQGQRLHRARRVSPIAGSPAAQAPGGPSLPVMTPLRHGQDPPDLLLPLICGNEETQRALLETTSNSFAERDTELGDPG